MIISKLSRSDRCIVKLLRLTGYRVDDILHTRVWMWSGDRITIKERKTGNIRTVLITPEIKRVVDEYKGLQMGSVSPLRYLVPARRHRPEDRKKAHRTTLWRHFEKAVSKAGLSGFGYSLHSLRKCYAVDLLRETSDIDRVQAALGHKYTSTTMIYILDAMKLK